MNSITTAIVLWEVYRRTANFENSISSDTWELFEDFDDNITAWKEGREDFKRSRWRGVADAIYTSDEAPYEFRGEASLDLDVSDGRLYLNFFHKTESGVVINMSITDDLEMEICVSEQIWESGHVDTPPILVLLQTVGEGNTSSHLSLTYHALKQWLENDQPSEKALEIFHKACGITPSDLEGIRGFQELISKNF